MKLALKTRKGQLVKLWKISFAKKICLGEFKTDRIYFGQEKYGEKANKQLNEFQ